jgi:hypothetical protein
LSDTPETNRLGGWPDAWPDLLAFAIGLATAWHFRWQTTDLVWSLWLSSLLVGYATIVWNIFGPVYRFSREAHRNGANFAAQAALTGISAFGGLFLLAFFTVHFGMFHFVHSVFLNSFFPVMHAKTSPGVALYLEVLRRYWYFVPLAALAERQAFMTAPVDALPDTSVKAADVNRRLAQAGRGGGMMAPYKNVIRMHLLIFFFVFVHIAGLDGFLVYAVVYAVYFFPWRLVKRAKPELAAQA